MGKNKVKIEWKKFFSGGNSSQYRCYYLAVVDGVRVEKMTSTKGSDRYSIGNMDNAKKKYKSESELLEALNKIK